MSFIYIWRYRVHPDQVKAFEQLYGPEGEWVQLFRQYEGYQHTLLLKDRSEPLLYLTIDTWSSKAAFDSFRSADGEAFSALDQKGELLTSSEISVGSYELVE